MIYLDNAATTVCKFPASVYDDIWGNANTPYNSALMQDKPQTSAVKGLRNVLA